MLAAAGALGGVMLLLVFGSCNTPFIPLPPPGDPTFTPVTITDGMGGPRMLWETRGGPAPEMTGARVFVYNLDAGSGVIGTAGPDGSYVVNPMEGTPGDRIQLRYEMPDGRHSPDICRVLERGLARAACVP
jgi:hypothetical protein